MGRRAWIAAFILACGTPVSAQESASYKIRESVLNAAGHPEQGTILSSPSYHVRLDSLGEGLAGDLIGSASFHLDGGFAAGNPPPGEVTGERFESDALLTWDPEPSVGVYEVYRDTLASLPGSFGACVASGLLSPEYAEVAIPAVGTGFFYLVTATNRLGEEGTKGWQSDGVQRTNSLACP